eukprot:1161661-Pelagomonas_calceolata.AAC.2
MYPDFALVTSVAEQLSLRRGMSGGRARLIQMRAMKQVAATLPSAWPRNHHLMPSAYLWRQLIPSVHKSVATVQEGLINQFLRRKTPITFTLRNKAAGVAAVGRSSRVSISHRDRTDEYGKGDSMLGTGEHFHACQDCIVQ